jgi:hypothetical protein
VIQRRILPDFGLVQIVKSASFNVSPAPVVSISQAIIPGTLFLQGCEAVFQMLGDVDRVLLQSPQPQCYMHTFPAPFDLPA